MGLFIKGSSRIQKSRNLEFLGRREKTPKAKTCYTDSGWAFAYPAPNQTDWKPFDQTSLYKASVKSTVLNCFKVTLCHD